MTLRRQLEQLQKLARARRPPEDDGSRKPHMSDLANECVLQRVRGQLSIGAYLDGMSEKDQRDADDFCQDLAACAALTGEAPPWPETAAAGVVGRITGP